MRFLSAAFLFTLSLLGTLGPVNAQGSLSFALQQQFSFTNCATNTNACGTPLIGGKLFFYQAGTTATRQDSFQDTGLTILNPWPLTLDGNGRIPNFYLANGSIHAQLVDINGQIQFDVPSMLVLGPSSGGGGGGTVDPTTIASTGDIKFRPTGEFVIGWVKLNGQTIGSAVSGATQRSNADTQSLFVYLWNNCVNAHCPVAAGRGSTGLADFAANKTIGLPDLRGRMLAGLDDMGATAAGRIAATNVTSGGGDTQTTPAGTGGESNHTLTFLEIPGHTHGVFLNDPGHVHASVVQSTTNAPSTTTAFGQVSAGNTASATTGITVRDTAGGGGTANQTAGLGGNAPAGGLSHNTMGPFMLGSWYQKL